ncbi:transcript variant X2 [Nothobranchius furzeri]|uniref:Transcript variant X1 n=1 Tax=Nothobranchius furzeri TaxID=105023 RepID=A0A9D2Z2P7_NOTFU|nr:transcript variant X1 [Nothobranchius furzeri]KAF7230254.1 transcript variant X2 [Nothobranchius furzeri]
MLEPPELSLEILEWLSTLRLTQYTSFFHHSGYHSLEDCKDLTDERLLQLNVLPTGHRRRILRSLEDQGLKQKSGEEVEAEEDVEGKMGENKPALHPRHVFLKDRNKGMAYPHNQTKEKMEYDLQGSHNLPAGAAMAADEDKLPESRNLQPPVPAPRNIQSIRTPASAQTNMPSHRTSSSSESPSNSDAPSDIEVSSEEHLPELAEDHEGFHCEMVDNSIYESQPCGGLKPTRSYRLRHRPVPEIPNQTTASVQDRSAQTSNPEHLTGSERPIGADGSQKAPLQRTSTAIAPYGETFLYNNPEHTLEQAAKEGLPKTFKAKMRQKKKRRKSMECSSVLFDPEVAEYSTVDECVSMVPRIGLDQTSALNPDTAAAGPQLFVSKDASVIEMVECCLYSQHADARGAITKSAQPDISPYACFYGAPKQQVLKVGWLDKLSPQGKCVFQRRWVRFDGESLAYFNNDKEMYSKGMVLASAIRQVRGLGDNKFEVVTSLRTFVFRAEKEGERQEWMEILQTATHPPACSSQKCSDNLLLLSSANKRGLLELRGYKGRVLASLVGSKVRLCKTEQDYRAGLGIAEVELTAATIRDADRRSFEINTPFKNFCFVADSEREKGEWIEAVQESITETLYDYEVAEKIWFNKANRSCADCRAPRPEWAAVNLGVVICKKCAGQHRSLGPSLSKVRSLKLDTSVWSNELVELFLEVGNKSANDFWAANLPMEEELHSAATTEQRATFIRRKYRERKYMKVLEGFHDLEQLNKALCAAVVTPDTLQTMMLVFSGADVMCATGDQTFSTPYLLAQHAGQKLQMEFLHHNKLSDFPKLEHLLENTSLSSASQFMDGFLYISTGPTKATLDRRGKDDMVRRWCTLEAGFLSYYESERSTLAIGRVDVTEVVSLAINNSETMTGAGAVFTVELFLQTERALIVGAGTQATQHDWIQALTKCFVPSKVEGLVRRSSEVIGRLYCKEGHDLYHWRMGWFMLEGSVLHFNLGDDKGEDEVLQLKQLQELSKFKRLLISFQL